MHALPYLSAGECDAIVHTTRQWERRRVPPARWLNLHAAAQELQRLYEMAIRESRKPVVQQAKVPEPKHIMNVVLFPMPEGVLRK